MYVFQEKEPLDAFLTKDCLIFYISCFVSDLLSKVMLAVVRCSTQGVVNLSVFVGVDGSRGGHHSKSPKSPDIPKGHGVPSLIFFPKHICITITD